MRHGGVFVDRKRPDRRVVVVHDAPTGVAYRYVRDGKHRRMSTLSAAAFDARFTRDRRCGSQGVDEDGNCVRCGLCAPGEANEEIGGR